MSEEIITVSEVTENERKMRLDKFLALKVPEISRSRLQNLILDGNVSCDDVIITDNSFKVRVGDGYQIIVPPAIDADPQPENILLNIVYEDDDLIVINKPAGMTVHPAPGAYSGTLVNALLFHCADKLSGIGGVKRPGIVHRIDRDTTGSLIVCKNDKSHNDIAAQLKEHSINRRYHAICYGVIKEAEGTIDKPIGRHPQDRKKMAVNEKNGKRAVTHYRVLKRFAQYTYIECVLETGRTHQLRVHMASIGHPLLGDDLYSNRKCPFKLQGQTLHAKTLGFEHPTTKEYIEIDAPLPEYFQNLLEILNNM